MSTVIRLLASDKPGTGAPPEGWCWWVVVQHVANGLRMHLPLPAPHDYPIDPPESDARLVWTRRCPPGPKRWVRKVKKLGAAA